MLNLIFPQTCGYCNKIYKEAVCPKCKIKLKNLERAKIIKHNKCFNLHIYLYKYEGIIREKILDYKFEEKAYLYKSFVNNIISNKNILEVLQKHEIIIPVPMYCKKENKRGYNQTKLIAKELGKYLNLKYHDNILYKNKNTIEQSKLNKKERAENVKDIYIIKNKEIIKDKNILLFDDIFTTGSTVNECSKILKQNGAGEIDVLTIAKD